MPEEKNMKWRKFSEASPANKEKASAIFDQVRASKAVPLGTDQQMTYIDVYTENPQDRRDGPVYRVFKTGTVDLGRPETDLGAEEGNSEGPAAKGGAATVAAKQLLAKMAEELRYVGSANLDQAQNATSLARAARQFVGMQAVEVARILEGLATEM